MECLRNSNFQIIKTFNDVTFDEVNRPLVICDIDHTFIKCLHDIDYFHKMLDNDLNVLSNVHTVNINVEKEAFDLMINAYNLGFVKQTDEVGFNNMLAKINQYKGKLVFLTARGILSHDKTIKELKKAGLHNAETFEIHYTNNEITKGEYIQKMRLTNDYRHISFIDDYPSYILSVQTLFPNIHCYLFNYD